MQRRLGRRPGALAPLAPPGAGIEARELGRLAAEHEVVKRGHQAQRGHRAGRNVDALERPRDHAAPRAVLGRAAQQRHVQRRTPAPLEPAREASQALAQ